MSKLSSVVVIGPILVTDCQVERERPARSFPACPGGASRLLLLLPQGPKPPPPFESLRAGEACKPAQPPLRVSRLLLLSRSLFFLLSAVCDCRHSASVLCVEDFLTETTSFNVLLYCFPAFDTPNFALRLSQPLRTLSPLSSFCLAARRWTKTPSRSADPLL